MLTRALSVLVQTLEDIMVRSHILAMLTKAVISHKITKEINLMIVTTTKIRTEKQLLKVVTIEEIKVVGPLTQVTRNQLRRK